MKLTNLIVEGFKRIVAVNINLGEYITELTGDNEQGKSSTIDAMWLLFDGKRVAPSEIIRKGAERCLIRGRLGDLTIERTFRRTRKGDITDSLRIERAGEAFPPTETQLRDMIGEHQLDPGDFLKLKPSEKFDALQMFVPNVDFRAIDNLQRADYNRRADVNRMAKEARAAAAMIQVNEDERPLESPDESALVQQLQAAGIINADIERERAVRASAQELLATLEQRILSTGEELERVQERAYQVCAKEVARLTDQIENLHQQIKQTQTACEDTIRMETERCNQQLNKMDREKTLLQGKLDSLAEIEMPVDTAAIAAEIQEARKINQAFERAAQKKRYITIAEMHERESEEITHRRDSREKAKQEAIAAADLPVEGLSFENGEVFLDGLPFEQASTARKIRVGVSIAVKRNPKLRLIWIRDASLFDQHSYQLVAELAKEFDCQIVLETVRKIGSDAIVIENGMVKQEAREEETA
jgi:predicted ATP-dependent endonuclease of OLD family